MVQQVRYQAERGTDPGAEACPHAGDAAGERGPRCVCRRGHGWDGFVQVV
ncbi:hypothetical protein GCM10011509_10260 [Ornithinimicrobium pekingense]|uniref:Uncharacterized protein n=1 Tax=Ornithinimicrobium pekingense TaxID=384677 RepID=A0ABQ2F5E6_9MICO|nr:hypothetical protein GCM10011509_10260 [Ornithinimicrobium pekingense]